MDMQHPFAEIAPVEAGDSPRRAPLLSPPTPGGDVFPHPPPKAKIPRFLLVRVDRFAELLSEGLHPREIEAALGLTRAEGAAILRRIRQDLGWQAV